MIYITGDTHGDFKRFTKKERQKLPVEPKKTDYMIICGDFGLLWHKSKEFEYNTKWLSELPFVILWVQGNHENYNMIAEYPVEIWNGGKVRHIVRDKIILLERGQVFTIKDKTFFTMGGASSHDIQGGILDKNSPTYAKDYKKAVKSGKHFRILNISWWKAELPTKEELQEGRENLEKVGYQVDYVISHCGSNRLQQALHKQEESNIKKLIDSMNLRHDSDNLQEVLQKYYKEEYVQDILTDYFEELEEKLQYRHWFCGHYHKDLVNFDKKHTILYKLIVPL